MELMVVGLNHNTAPVELREQVAFDERSAGTALNSLLEAGQLGEATIVSTCNRTECYCVGETAPAEEVVTWLAQHHGLTAADLSNSIYVFQGTAAVEHAMRVAAGLDSLVVGETQILGQMKGAFAAAEEHGSLGPYLHKLSQGTYRAAKLIRTSTGIGRARVSIASVAVQLAGQLFAELNTCTALLIGAGDTIALVARYLKTGGIQDMVICNRTLSRAQILADELDARAAPLTDLASLLNRSDIVISATSSPLPVLGKGTAENAVRTRRHKPIFMVDLAVPRDIEPEVSALADIYLYTVDDLEGIVTQNLVDRSNAADEAAALINAEAADLDRDFRALAAVNTLVSFRERHERLRDIELEKALTRLRAGDDPETVLTQFARQLTNKIVHTPSVELKRAGADGEVELLENTRRLFGLDDNT